MDLRANIDTSITLKPLERAIIKTGLYISLLPGFEDKCDHDGSAKKGINGLNSPGTVDADTEENWSDLSESIK